MEYFVFINGSNLLIRNENLAQIEVEDTGIRFSAETIQNGINILNNLKLDRIKPPLLSTPLDNFIKIIGNAKVIALIEYKFNTDSINNILNSQMRNMNTAKLIINEDEDIILSWLQKFSMPYYDLDNSPYNIFIHKESEHRSKYELLTYALNLFLVKHGPNTL